MQSAIPRRAFLAGMSALVLSGCAIPRGAASRREILSGAESGQADFVLEIVTRDRLAQYGLWGGAKSHLTEHWPAGGSVVLDQRIAPGDQLTLRIWDASDSSLLASPGAQFADIRNVVVQGSGHVMVPYVNSVHVAGLTLSAAQMRLQEELTTIIPAAQVQAEITQGRRNSVDFVSGVAKPGSYPLTERNLPLTSLLATAGGASADLVNPVVQITRGGRVFRKPLHQILQSPAMDTSLQGGDRVVILSDPRSFTALGAAGREEVIPFDADMVSALRAVSMMGGINDNRADPKGILVLRRYDSAATGDAAANPPRPNVVFSFDLTHADGMFVANEFALRDGDIVMATQAPATTLQRVLGLFGSVLGAGRAATSL